jgi:hypothetical protein
MKRRSKHTAKRRRASTTVKTAPVEPAFFVNADAARQVAPELNARHEGATHGALVLDTKSPAARRSARRQQKIMREIESGDQWRGTVTTWQRDGMRGLSITPPPPAKPRRKPDKETLALFRACAALVNAGKDDRRLAYKRWPNVSRTVAAGYLRVLKSKHPDDWLPLLTK